MNKPFDKNALNSMKGDIGEFLYANHIMQINDAAEIEDPDMQRYGVDWRITSGTHPIDIDVKLSPLVGDKFALTYRNGNNIRMPFAKDCSATWVAVVTFDWEQFKEDNTKQDEMVLAEKTRSTLRKEYGKLMTDSAGKAPLTARLLKKYVKSIVDVKVQAIRELCHGFSEKNDGDGNSRRGEIVATRVGSDNYAAAHIKWKAILPHQRILHYKNDAADHSATTPFALTVPWTYKRWLSEEQNKTLGEMETKSLKWLRTQNSLIGSTFCRKYHISQEAFGTLLTELIDQRIKK